MVLCSRKIYYFTRHSCARDKCSQVVILSCGCVTVSVLMTLFKSLDKACKDILSYGLSCLLTDI